MMRRVGMRVVNGDSARLVLRMLGMLGMLRVLRVLGMLCMLMLWMLRVMGRRWQALSLVGVMLERESAG